MALFLPRRWHRQPVGPVRIDWHNALSESLVAAINGNQQYDVVNRRTPSAGSYGYGFGPEGKRLETAATTGYQEFIGAEYQQTGAITVFSWAQAASGAYLAETAQSTGSINTPFEFIFTGASPKVYWARASTIAASYRVWQSTATFSYNTDYKICVTAPSGDVTAAPTMYVNGTTYANTNTDGTGTGNAGVSSTNKLYIGKREDGGAGAVKTYVFFLWSRALNQDEVIELTDNPWQMFAPIVGRTYFDAIAAAPSFNAAWNVAANTVITTGARAA